MIESVIGLAFQSRAMPGRADALLQGIPGCRAQVADAEGVTGLAVRRLTPETLLPCDLGTKLG